MYIYIYRLSAIFKRKSQREWQREKDKNSLTVREYVYVFYRFADPNCVPRIPVIIIITLLVTPRSTFSCIYIYTCGPTFAKRRTIFVTLVSFFFNARGCTQWLRIFFFFIENKNYFAVILKFRFYREIISKKNLQMRNKKN